MLLEGGFRFNLVIWVGRKSSDGMFWHHSDGRRSVRHITRLVSLASSFSGDKPLVHQENDVCESLRSTGSAKENHDVPNRQRVL